MSTPTHAHAKLPTAPLHRQPLGARRRKATESSYRNWIMAGILILVVAAVIIGISLS